MRKQERQWTGVTKGGTLGQWMLIRMLSIVNPTLLYFPLALIVPFYMLFNKKEYGAIYEYFRTQWGYFGWKAFSKTYQNHFIFGQCMLDKFAVYAGKKNFFNVKITGKEEAEKMLHDGRGIVVTTSHVGNFELLGYLSQLDLPADKNPFSTFQAQNRDFHIMFGQETETILSNRVRSLSDHGISTVHASDNMTHLFAIRESLLNGGIVDVTCDRFTGSDKSITCDFLNGRADFPTSTFALAAHCNTHVLSVFCMKESRNCYHIYFKIIDADEVIQSNEKINCYVKSYVRGIEEMLGKYPEQWFNFYKFWK
ncbi:MAG: lysophospholipid acyltransferase family protein [Bacteroidales bacterium]|jgi:predicted LPLAT superfamily acyltransferase|nr:lysophospholipid acyltransferase family protein [Bacteroidales bacterium]